MPKILWQTGEYRLIEIKPNKYPYEEYYVFEENKPDKFESDSWREIERYTATTNKALQDFLYRYSTGQLVG